MTVALWVICATMVGGVLLMTFLASQVYLRYLPGPSRSGWALAALMLCLVLTALATNKLLGRLQSDWRGHESIGQLLAAQALCFFVVPLVVKQWQLWFSGGGAGIRAEHAPVMFTPGDAVCVVAVAGGACLAFGLSFWMVLAISAAVVAVGPVVWLMLHEPVPTPRTTAPAPMDERQRVLKLLEDGKITADESAELLSALGPVSQPQGEKMNLSRSSVLVLVGAAVVLVGFLLPWYAVNLGEELGRAMQGTQMQLNMPEMPGMPEIPRMNWPGGMPAHAPVQTGTTYISGGQLQNGMGWIVLAASVALAVFPFVTSMAEQARRTVSLVVLGVGAVLVLYLVTQGWRHVYVGLMVVIGGYVLQAVGLLRPRIHVPAGTGDVSRAVTAP